MSTAAPRDLGRLSPHFHVREFAVSAAFPQLALPVPVRYWPSVRTLAVEVLEPLRTAFGGPLRILSGYRSPALNRAVGGSATSQHVVAEAADLYAGGDAAAERLFRLLLDAEPRLPFGQAIWYPDRAFVHVALPSHRFPRPTGCVHWPAGGIDGYPIVRDSAALDTLLARRRR